MKLNQLFENRQVLNEVLRQVDGKWALVSPDTGKPLRYYKGEGKPSQEWVDDQERQINYFKNKDKFEKKGP
jgi:hypothetical protein